MNWWKKHKWKVLAPVVIVVVLAFAFWYGGSAPGLQGWTAGGGSGSSSQAENGGDAQPSGGGDRQDNQNGGQQDGGGAQTPDSPEDKDPAGQSQEGQDGNLPEDGGDARQTGGDKNNEGAQQSPEGNKNDSGQGGMAIDPETGKDQYQTDPVPEGKPLPVEPQDVEITGEQHTCTLSIRCDTILSHIDWLDPDKVELVPGDGVILAPTAVTFYEGENVFNILQRTCKQQKIHMEFSDTPAYNSAYIEGIHNLYEFDCGEQSGWMYRVNGWFPNYGCSRYELKDGDVVEWLYTCDLGGDIGGSNALGG